MCDIFQTWCRTHVNLNTLKWGLRPHLCGAWADQVWSKRDTCVEREPHKCGRNACFLWWKLQENAYLCYQERGKRRGKTQNNVYKQKTTFLSKKRLSAHLNKQRSVDWLLHKKSLNPPRIYQPRIKAVPTPYQDRSNTAPLEANMTCPRTTSGGGQTARSIFFMSFQVDLAASFTKQGKRVLRYIDAYYF